MPSCVCHANDCLLCEAHLREGLTAEQACEIQGLLCRRTLQPHEILFRQGESSQWLYVVRAGQLKLTVVGPNGHEQIIRIAVPGRLIGYDAVDDRQHPYTATAITPARLCGIRHRDMLRVLEQNPEVSRRLVQLLNRELSQAQALVQVLGQKSAAEKIALFLLSLAPERDRQDTPAELPMPLSRREIADMLGLAVETVSRLMAELKRSRIIEAPRGGHIRILDRRGLSAFTEGAPSAAPPGRRAAE